MLSKGNSLFISPSVVSLEGEESRKFLQALISADIDGLTARSAQTSLLLNPSGKTMFAMYVYCESDEHFLLISEPNPILSLGDSLKRFLIRTKATINDVTGQYYAELTEEVKGDATLLTSKLLGSEGLNLYLHDGQIDKENEEEFENLRISHGAVSVARDLGDNSIAQEANLEREAVSFNKGCFLGQELVCRIDSRSASTPFSYFLAVTQEPVSAGAQLQFGNEVIGEVTSSDNSGASIVRLSRKGVALLNEGDTSNLSVDKDIVVDRLSPVGGYFRV